MLHCLNGIVPNLYEFVLWNIKDILKNVGNQTILVTTDFNCLDKKH